MKAKGMLALGAAAIALLIGPGAAWAQDEGTADATAPVQQADPPAAPDPAPATTPDPSTTPEVTAPADPQTSSDTPDTVATDTTAAPATDTSSDTSDPAVESTAPADATVDQPQAQVETTSQKVEDIGKAKTGGGSCLTRAAAPGSNPGVGPPGPGCTRIDGPQISKDPANPTVLPPINGVTIGIWVEDTQNGPLVHWQVISGTFSGTDAIDIKVKGGPDPNGFTCQVTNDATTGVCHPPVNPNNGKFYGVSHVDVCPGSTTVPPPNIPTPPGGSGGVAGQVGSGGQNGQQGTKGSKGSKKGSSGTSPSVSQPAVAAVPTQAAGGLPVTGLAVLWLFLIGTGLLGGGAILRTRHE
jgi:hypothetical protein